jgi:hypothetical protein
LNGRTLLLVDCRTFLLIDCRTLLLIDRRTLLFVDALTFVVAFRLEETLAQVSSRLLESTVFVGTGERVRYRDHLVQRQA